MGLGSRPPGLRNLGGCGERGGMRRNPWSKLSPVSAENVKGDAHTFLIIRTPCSNWPGRVFFRVPLLSCCPFFFLSCRWLVDSASMGRACTLFWRYGTAPTAGTFVFGVFVPFFFLSSKRDAFFTQKNHAGCFFDGVRNRSASCTDATVWVCSRSMRHGDESLSYVLCGHGPAKACVIRLSI